MGIGATEAWDITTGSRQVRVGVIDTGIANHPDLNANLVSGWDFENNNSITNDDIVGHGTHVAGIIGATGANLNGVSGVCQNVQIVPMQTTFDEEGHSKEDVIVKAITWAISNNIDMINYSMGQYEKNIAIKAAISNFQGLFICSSGNEGNNNDKKSYYASDYSQGQSFSDRVISVGSIDENGAKSSFSNYGAKTVSVFAPGEKIVSTFLNNGYASLSGTSMATPYVTGTAALMLSVINSKSTTLDRAEIAVQIKNNIMRNVTRDIDLGSYCVSSGRLNAFKALKKLKLEKYENVIDEFGYQGSTFSWHGKVDMTIENYDCFYINEANKIVFTSSCNLTFMLSTISSSNAWATINGKVEFQLKNSAGETMPIEGNDTHTCTIDVDLVNNVKLSNPTFLINLYDLPTDTYTLTLRSELNRASWSDHDEREFTFIVDKPTACIIDNSFITLSDGTQKAVEELTGDEKLLVWNFFTGTFDTAPILFVDHDPAQVYEVINLTFSDGTTVKVISEHGFWDFDLNEYVFLRNDAAKYIGHWFNKQTTDENGNFTYTRVQLTNVIVQNGFTSAWSPVTYGHLCYYVNGMLSMPGATTGLINIFNVDTDTMKIDETKYLEDIAEYGLFTYEEFAAIYPVSEVIFEAFGGKYLKVAIGKGLLTEEMLESLIARYSVFF